MKIVSFNINGLRARPAQLKAIVETHQPDVIGLQETKVADDQFPREEIEALGYQVHFHGQKGHYGVALLSRQAPLEIRYGFPNDGEDAQRRFIWGTFADADGQPITVMNGYFPQGESREHPVKFPAKQRFYADLQQLLESQFKPEQRLVIMGDINTRRKTATSASARRTASAGCAPANAASSPRSASGWASSRPGAWWTASASCTRR